MSLTGAAFLLAFFATLTLALRDPRFGFYTYLAMFYLHPPSRWWGASLPDLRWALVAAVVTLALTLRLPADDRLPKWHQMAPARLLIAFTIWLWIQNLWALARPEHLEVSVLFTKYLILYYLMQRLVNTQQQIGNFLLAHVIGCGYLGWLAYLAPDVGRLEGVGGPGIDEANALGMFLATGAVCAGLLVLGERSWRRWLCLATLPFIGNAIVQSESRGALLGLFAGGLVVLYLLPKGTRLKAYGLGAAALAAFVAIAPPVYWERLTTLQAAVDEQVEMDTSAESRMVIIRAQWRMWLAYPMGSGHRGTAELSRQYLDEVWLTKTSENDLGARSSHNTMMSALAEQGVPGIVIFIALGLWLAAMIFTVKRLARREPPDPKTALYGACAAGSLTVVFVAGLFTDYLKTEVQVWMFAVLGLVVALRRLQLSEAQAAKASVPAALPAAATGLQPAGPGRR